MHIRNGFMFGANAQTLLCHKLITRLVSFIGPGRNRAESKSADKTKAMS